MVKKLKDKMEILRVFEDIISWKTIKQVSKEIKLSYQPVYTYLKELEKEGFLRHKQEGNVHLYSFNLKNKNAVKAVENIEFRKSQEFIKGVDRKINFALNELIKQAQDRASLWLILLFGSTARKSRIKTSDIDIFIVAGKNDEIRIKSICNTLNMKYNLKISPITVSSDEFRKMLIERNNFIQNLIKEKIILYGYEFYFNELIKSMEKLKWI